MAVGCVGADWIERGGGQREDAMDFGGRKKIFGQIKRENRKYGRRKVFFGIFTRIRKKP